MSNEITVDLDDYLSNDDKVQLARDAFKAAAMRRSGEDFERILSNAAYSMVREEVNAAFDGDMVAVVKTRALDVINKLSAFTVFNKPDAWQREASKGWTHLQQAVDDAAPLIHARVQQIVSEMGEDRLRDMIESQIVAAIIGKLTAREVTP